MKNYLISIICCLTFHSCKMQQMALETTFEQNADMYPVKGRQGWLINQKMAFGDFKTKQIKRGWTSSYNIPLIVRFRGAKEKLYFSLGDSTLQSEVFCVSKVATQELSLLRDLFSVYIDSKDIFTGSIVLKGGDTTLPAWNFLISNPNNLNPLEISDGFATNGIQRIEVKNVREIKGSNHFLSKMNIYGYVLMLDNEVIGAVESFNNGRIFLKKGLNPTLRFVAANVATALLLRSDLNR
jgi:hypothetical protein